MTIQNLKSAFLSVCCTVIAFTAANCQVLINEYSASNLHFHQDGFGDYTDYIELYNTSASPVDLSGYYLSENLNDPTKWQIPAGVVIPAYGFEIFYLSAKLTTQFDGQHYHLPFQITQTEPEEVVFADPAGVVIDSVAVTLATQMDHSRGRTTDGGPDWGVMTEPTPNAPNANVYDTYTEKPVFDLPPGFYTGTQVISISVTDPTHVIRYTTNGTKPTWTSPVYSGPITINNTVTIRARSFPPGGGGGGTSPPYCDQNQGSAGFPDNQGCEDAICAADPFCCNNQWDGMCAGAAETEPACAECLSTYTPPPPSGENVFPGFTETNTYFIDETFTMQTIAISGQLGQWNAGGGGGWVNVNGNWFNYYEVCLEYFDENGICQDELEGMLRRHGNDSWAFPQRGMRFHSRDQMGFDNNIEHQLFPHSNRDHFDVLIMKAGGSDNYPGNGWLPSAHLRDGFAQTASQRGDLELDERSYNHHIKFMNGEYWGLFEMRERIDKDYTEYYYDQEEEFVDMLEYWGGLTEEYGNDNDWVLLYNFVTGNDMSVQLNYDYVTTQLNPESFIDNFVLNTYFVNTDWLNWNTKWWRGTQGTGVRWRYALWDLDNTFNLGQNYTGWSSTGPYVNVVCEAQEIFQNWGSSNGHTAMYSSLLDNQGFFEDYISRYSDLLNTALHCDTLVALLDEFEARMLPEMPRQVNRWGGSVAQWQNRIQDIREFICIRWDIVNQQIIDCFEDDYDISGPYEITVVIVGPGNVELNTITIASGPWTGNYFGGLDLDLTAVPLANGEFIEWSLNNNYTGQDLLNLNLPITPLNGNDTIFAYFNFIDPLPVEWLSFEGEVINNWGELYWSTATEVNSSHFEVQRSADGIYFEKIDEVQAAGNSSSPRNYRATDKSTPEGLWYYRLKQIDFNGDYSFSNIIALDYGLSVNSLLVAPNPNNGVFNIVNQTQNDISSELLSPLGQFMKKIDLPKNRTTHIELPTFSSGIYTLRYRSGNEVNYLKIAVH